MNGASVRATGVTVAGERLAVETDARLVSRLFRPVVEKARGQFAIWQGNRMCSVGVGDIVESIREDRFHEDVHAAHVGIGSEKASVRVKQTCVKLR